MGNDNEDDVDVHSGKVMTQSQSKITKGGVLKGKVVAVTKLMRMYKLPSTEQENIRKLKQLSPNGQLPHGVLAGGSKERADKVHEALPNANPNWEQKKKTIFFSKNMDTEEKEK